jgi:hypothetical protein
MNHTIANRTSLQCIQEQQLNEQVKAAKGKKTKFADIQRHELEIQRTLQAYRERNIQLNADEILALRDLLENSSY